MHERFLACSGLASCLNITARMVLDQWGLLYDKVVVKVDIVKENEGVSRFIYEVDIIGDLDDGIKSRIKNILSKSPVVKTLVGSIRVEQGEVS